MAEPPHDAIGNDGDDDGDDDDYVVLGFSPSHSRCSLASSYWPTWASSQMLLLSNSRTPHLLGASTPLTSPAASLPASGIHSSGA